MLNRLHLLIFYGIPLLLYQFFTLISIPIVILYLVIIRKIQSKNIFGNWRHRIGFVPLSQKNKKTFWFHAVSAGEVLSLEYLIKKITADNKLIHCYLTVGTQTGYNLAIKNINCATISYLPYDFLPCLLLAKNRINAKKLIITEAELWPNLIAVHALANIPCYLINARIKEKKTIIQILYNLTIVHLFNFFTEIYTQDTQTINRIPYSIQKKTPTYYGGTTKSFNVIKKIENFKKEYLIKNTLIYPTLLIGSCHPGELAIYLRLFNNCKKIIPTLKLIIVPRHMHWQKELIASLKRYNYSFNVINTNESFTSINTIIMNNDIVAVFLMGTLFSLYQYATLFFLGGTWVPVGGHNLLEPIGWQIPSIVGPDYHTCTELVETLKNLNGIFIAHNEQNLNIITQKILLDQVVQKTTKENAFTWLMQEKQQTEIIMDRLFKTMIQ